jgi:hypothetical protein
MGITHRYLLRLLTKLKARSTNSSLHHPVMRVSPLFFQPSYIHKRWELNTYMHVLLCRQKVEETTTPKWSRSGDGEVGGGARRCLTGAVGWSWQKQCMVGGHDWCGVWGHDVVQGGQCGCCGGYGAMQHGARCSVGGHECDIMTRSGMWRGTWYEWGGHHVTQAREGTVSGAERDSWRLSSGVRGGGGFSPLTSIDYFSSQ